MSAGKGAVFESRPFTATWVPSSFNVVATARPMPRVPPQTSATRPARPRSTAPYDSRGLFDSYRANLQLRHLRVRIEHGIGEQIGRRFAEMEGDEPLARRAALADARGAHHRVAPRREPNQLPFAHAELPRVFGMNLDDRGWLARIQAARAPAHGAGVPMVELATRVHDERVIVVMNTGDRKSTRLNSSHLGISYAVFCLKKKK